MHRQTNYAYQNPSEDDFLYAQRFAYEGLGLLAMDILGTSTLVSGLACTPTGPASMSVQIGPGRIYSRQNLEDTAWGLFNSIGGLPVDTNADHQVIKQGLFRDTTVLATMAAPGTTGQSINYLIEASFSEVDAVPLSLPFVSATAPYPPIAPNTLNTVRQDKCVITVKAGTAATTGSQTTPAPDAGCVGLWVVTVANGQTSIIGGNISQYGSAPFISETLTQKISQATADARYLQPATGAQLQYVSTTSLKLAAVNGGMLAINGVNYPVPSGLTLANTGLAGTTLLYVYAFMNSGAMTLEAVTTAPNYGTANGIPIKTGDVTRTLVGMVYTAAGTPGLFTNTAAAQNVASYFNRRNKVMNNATTGGFINVSASTPTEVQTAARGEIVTWGDEATVMTLTGSAIYGAVSTQASTTIGVDGTSQGAGGASLISSTITETGMNAQYSAVLSEGHHVISPFAYTRTTDGATAGFGLLMQTLIRS